MNEAILFAIAFVAAMFFGVLFTYSVYFWALKRDADYIDIGALDLEILEGAIEKYRAGTYSEQDFLDAISACTPMHELDEEE